MDNLKWFKLGKEEEVFGRNEYKDFLESDQYDGEFNAREQFEAFLLKGESND